MALLSMSIFVIGINHKTAPIVVREKIYFNPDRINLYLQELLLQELVREVVLLKFIAKQKIQTQCMLGSARRQLM
jgi:hypothetical protein